MSKTFRSVAVATLLVAGLSFPASADPVTLRVTATPSIFSPMFEGFVEAFAAENPDVQIVLEVSTRDQIDAIQDILRDSLVDDLPDVSFQGYNYVRTLADRDLTVPLNSFIAGDPDWNEQTYSSSVADSATLAGQVHGLGVAMAIPILYYNADLVDTAQGEGAPFPDTWEGVIALSRQIGALDRDIIGGFHRVRQWFFQAQIESRGGSLMNDDEDTLAFAGPEGLSTFEVVAAFGEAGQADAFMTREQARQAFVSGVIGILTDTSSVMLRHDEQVGGRFRLGTAPFPIPADDGRVPAAGVAAVMLTRDDERQAAAWEFMKFVAGEQGQLIVAETTGYIPANLAAIENSPELSDLLAGRPLMAAALSALPRVSAWYAFPGANAARIDNQIAEHMRMVSTLELSPEEALTSLANQVEALLPQ